MIIFGKALPNANLNMLSLIVSKLSSISFQTNFFVKHCGSLTPYQQQQYCVAQFFEGLANNKSVTSLIVEVFPLSLVIQVNSTLMGHVSEDRLWHARPATREVDSKYFDSANCT